MMEPLNAETNDNQKHYLIGIIEVFTQWRRFIFICAFASVLISGVVAFLIPPMFKSVASVLPAEQADLFSSLESISSLARSFSPVRGLAGLGDNREVDRYLAILKSSRVLEKVITEFDLVHVYDITSYPKEKTTKELLSNVDFVVEDEGSLTITVYDQDPDRAAKMANFFVEELNRSNSELQAQNARSNRQFIQDRYEKNLKDLASAEDSLKLFQKRFGVISMPEQTDASIKAGAELAAQLTLKEVQLSVEQRTQSREHPSVIALSIEVEELKKKLSAMNKISGNASGDMKLLVPFASIPDLGAEYIRRYRDVEIQYKILQFITPLYEQSKVEEQRQTPSVIVLDRAFPAERKSKPKRLLIILGGLLVGLLSSVGYVGIRSRWHHEQEKNGMFYQVSANLLSALSADLRGLVRGRGAHGRDTHSN